MGKWSCKRTDVKNKIKSFELINIISRIKTSLSGVNSRLEMAEERSNDPKDQLTEIIYSEQDKEKRFFSKTNNPSCVIYIDSQSEIFLPW